MTIKLLGFPIAREVLLHAPQLTKTAPNTLILEHGNMTLLAGADPWVFETPQGIIINMGSHQQRQQRLAFNLILWAAKALMEILIHRHHYSSASFSVSEDGVQMGGGRLRIKRE